MGGRADRCGEAGADADHQGDEERVGLIAQFFGSLIHDGEEHGTRCCVGNELGNKGAHETDSRHDDDRIGAADIEDAKGEALGNACLLDGDTQHNGACKHHKNLPVDSLHGLVDVTALEQEHGHCS